MPSLVTALEKPARPPCLADIRDELRAAGLGHPAALRTFAKFSVLVALALGSLAWVAANPGVSLLVRAPVALLATWFLTSAAMCGHDGAHGATSHRGWVNTLLGQLGFTLLGGLSVTYWRHKHNALHHPNVNVAMKDPDVEQGLLALSTRQHVKRGPLVRYLQKRIQAPVFWLVGAPLVLVDLKITSIRYVLTELAKGRGRRAPLLADLAWIVAHYVAWLVLPLAFLPLATVLAVYALCTIVPGFHLAFIFSPAHVPYPLVKEFHDPLRLQLASTRNLRTNWFFRATLIGLDRQIEHHLAPMLPHFELGKAAPIVRAYCARHGLPYQETGWFRALLDTHAQVRDGWRIDEVVVGAS
jgi:fatty acid desaturase